jgi:hypothetical protein
MQHRDLLNEKLLVNEFKFGFELEAIIDGYDEDTWEEGYEEIQHIFFGYFVEKGSVDDDGSIESSSGLTFEWASPVLSFTPQTIKQCITFLDDLPKYNIHTNNTCGFHVHMSFPAMSPVDVRWIVFQVALDDTIQETIDGLNDIDFFEMPHALKGYLTDIRKVVEGSFTKEEKINRLMKLLNDEKYRTLRIHPQGTLEWRGPRGFLQEYNRQVIKDFFLLLWKFISWITGAVSRTSMAGFTKDDFVRKTFSSWRDEYKRLAATLDSYPKKINLLADDILYRILDEQPEKIEFINKKLPEKIQKMLFNKIVKGPTGPSAGQDIIRPNFFNVFDEKYILDIITILAKRKYYTYPENNFLSRTDIQKKLIDRTDLSDTSIYNLIIRLYRSRNKLTDEAMEYICSKDISFARELAGAEMTIWTQYQDIVNRYEQDRE